MAKKKIDKPVEDAESMYWRSKGGDFRDDDNCIVAGSGKTATMPSAKLLPLLKELREVPVVSWGPYLPGSRISKARMMMIDGKPLLKFERWEEDPSLDSVDKALQAIALTGAIFYERVKDEWLTT